MLLTTLATPSLLRLDAQAGEPVQRYTGGGAPKGAVMVVVLVLLYLLPNMLALAGGKRRRWKIVAINVLLGWTVIGWIAAMVMNWAYEAPESHGP